MNSADHSGLPEFQPGWSRTRPVKMYVMSSAPPSSGGCWSSVGCPDNNRNGTILWSRVLEIYSLLRNSHIQACTRRHAHTRSILSAENSGKKNILLGYPVSLRWCFVLTSSNKKSGDGYEITTWTESFGCSQPRIAVALLKRKSDCCHGFFVFLFLPHYSRNVHQACGWLFVGVY